MKRAVVCVAVVAVLFCALWSNPSARVAFLHHFWSGPSATYFGYTPTVALSDKLGLTPDAVEVAQRFPQDAWWQWKAAQLKSLPQDEDSVASTYYENFNLPSSGFDNLVARFPQTMWLRTEQFNGSLPQQSWSTGRQPLPTATPFSTPAPAASSPLPPGAFAPPPAPTPTPYTVDENSLTTFTRGLALCEQSERVEPRNSFWNWMRAYCLFRLKRDNEALTALQQGARKPFYNNHNLEECQAALLAKQRLRPLDWAEKVQLLYTSSDYGTEERRGNVIALAVEQAEFRERAGQSAAALQIYDDLARLLRTSRLAATRLNSMYSLNRAASLVWSSNHRKDQAASLNGRANGVPLSRSLASTNNFPFVTTASLLANYATAHGRPDVAQRILAEDNQMFRQFSAWRRGLTNQNGLTDDETQRLLSFEWMGGIIAWQVIGLAIIWLTFAAILGVARALIKWRQLRNAAVTPPVAQASASPPARRVGWLTLSFAAVVPLGFSVGVIVVMFSTNLVGAVLYQYGSDSQSRLATLMLTSLVLATSAALLAIGIGSWGAKRLLIPAQSSTPRRTRWARVGRKATQLDGAPKPDDTLLTMPDEVEMSWLPLSRRAMRQLCAPFNWMLSLAMPLSWVALFVMGDRGTMAVPVAYLPGVASPVVTIDAPGWGFSIFLTFLVVLRWVFGVLTRDGRQWRAAKVASLAAESASSSPSANGAATSTPKRDKKFRGLPWNGMDSAFIGGVLDAVSVATVGSFALYIVLVWLALPLRAQANSHIDLTFQVGELQAAARQKAALQATASAPAQSPTASP